MSVCGLFDCTSLSAPAIAQEMPQRGRKTNQYTLNSIKFSIKANIYTSSLCFEFLSQIVLDYIKVSIIFMSLLTAKTNTLGTYGEDALVNHC